MEFYTWPLLKWNLSASRIRERANQIFQKRSSGFLRLLFLRWAFQTAASSPIETQSVNQLAKVQTTDACWSFWGLRYNNWHMQFHNICLLPMMVKWVFCLPTAGLLKCVNQASLYRDQCVPLIPCNVNLPDRWIHSFWGWQRAWPGCEGRERGNAHLIPEKQTQGSSKRALLWSLEFSSLICSIWDWKNPQGPFTPHLLVWTVRICYRYITYSSFKGKLVRLFGALQWVPDSSVCGPWPGTCEERVRGSWCRPPPSFWLALLKSATPGPSSSSPPDTEPEHTQTHIQKHRNAQKLYEVCCNQLSSTLKKNRHTFETCASMWDQNQ